MRYLALALALLLAAPAAAQSDFMLIGDEIIGGRPAEVVERLIATEQVQFRIVGTCTGTCVLFLAAPDVCTLPSVKFWWNESTVTDDMLAFDRWVSDGLEAEGMLPLAPRTRWSKTGELLIAMGTPQCR